jgi:phosphate starvation-inducible PhoH-like protein
MLANGTIKKLYVARPNVAKAKHKNGFLPGGIEDKTEPWLVPIFEGLREAMSPSEFARMRKEKIIEEVPFEFIQGRTFKNAACIVDEAENLDLDDLYITLTRQGEGLNMVLCGDIYQARIPDSGLATVIEMGQADGHESEGVIEFSEDEVVRSKQASQWVKSFAKRPHLLGFYNASQRKRALHNVTDCDMKDDNSFQSNPPEFLKGAA